MSIPSFSVKSPSVDRARTFNVKKSIVHVNSTHKSVIIITRGWRCAMRYHVSLSMVFMIINNATDMVMVRKSMMPFRTDIPIITLLLFDYTIDFLFNIEWISTTLLHWYSV